MNSAVTIPQHLHLKLFGSPRQSIGDTEVTGFRSAKTQALLYYLAVTGETHSRSTLATLFLPDVSPSKANSSLRNALSSLRKLMSDLPHSDRHSVSLHTNRLWLDTQQFTLLLQETNDPALSIQQRQAAVSLYSGDFLDGFHIDDAPDFEQWVTTTRQYFHQVMINALLDLATWYASHQDPTASLATLSHLLTMSPGNEAAHRLMMQVLAKTGQRAAAILQFDTYHRYLAEELGVDPDAETMALYAQLLEGNNVDITPYIDWGDMPGRTSFHGRTHQLIELTKRLPQELDAKLALLFAELAQQRVLLVFDNMESLMAPGDHPGGFRSDFDHYRQLFERMAHGRHQICLLITTREIPRDILRLATDYPHVYHLALTGLAPEQGVELLFKRHIKGNLTTLRALIDHYSGNPLALKLAAATVNDLYSGNVEAFLSDAVLVFDDIRSVLDQQFERLSELGRDLLVWLAINREPVGFDELQGDLVVPATRRALLEAIRAIKRSSLLQKMTPQDAESARNDGYGPRMTLHNVVMEYITDRLLTTYQTELKERRPAYFHRYTLCKAVWDLLANSDSHLPRELRCSVAVPSPQVATQATKNRMLRAQGARSHHRRRSWLLPQAAPKRCAGWEGYNLPITTCLTKQ